MPPADDLPAPAPCSLASVGALLGDPVRSAILLQLTDGSRRPAGELAVLAGASPQAASAHLARLVDGGLLAVQREGRHRFYRLASGEVAEMIEALSNWTDATPRRSLHDPALCRARLCYDHVAGRAGVAISDGMVAQGWLALGPEGPTLTQPGIEWCRGQGIAPAPPAHSRRPLLRLCLDWTERRPHLGGHLGAALAQLLLRDQCLSRRPNQRAVLVTGRGVAFLRRELSVDLER